MVGKEKEELLTLGRSFVDIKYTVNEELPQASKANIISNINSNDNISNKNNDSISTNNTVVKNDNKKENKNDNDNIIHKNNCDVEQENKKEIINKNTFNYKGKEISGTPKPSRRSITSYDLNKYNMKSKTKEDPLFNSKKAIPKKKDTHIITKNNYLMKQGQGIGGNMNSINSKRDMTKIINNNKPYPIIEQNTYLSQQLKNKTQNELESPKNENNDSLEIINSIEINKPNIDEPMEISDEMKVYDTFCIGVFVSGLAPPIKTNSIIENSENFMAPCGHLQCSIYPSIQPELLHTYINKNIKSFNNLSQLVANMCFPLGVKPCFGCRFEENNKIDNLPNPQQTFFNIIKNEKNEIYYIATLQYFIKMSNSDYLMKYKFNPITYFLEKTGNSSNKDKKFKNNMQMISNSLNNNNVFIPESISLISKYPLLTSMDKCLRCMVSLQSEDMNNLINHLINEVPSPKKNYQSQFFIPKIQAPLILNHEYNKFLSCKNNDNNNNNILSSSQINVKFLIEKVSVENIIMIFQLMLLEQKILFLENNYQILSEVSFIFLELIYPLVWTNPFLPVLSFKTVQFLQSPVPYIMGLDEYMLKYANESSNIYLGNDMIIYNLMTNQFISNKTKKRIHKKDIFHEFKLPTIPDKIGEYIYKELKVIKKMIEKNEKYKDKKDKTSHEIISDEELDKKIRMLFLKAMIMLIGDYNNFVFYTEDEIPLFNKEAFVQSHKNKNSQLFLGEMVKTQIFNQFLLNEKQLYIKTKNKLKDISNNNMNNLCGSADKNLNEIGDDKNNINNYELIDTSYFKKYISIHHDLLNSEKIRNRAFSSKKIPSKSSKKRTNSQRKNNFTASIYNNRNEDLMNYNLNSNANVRNNNNNNNLKRDSNNNLNVGIINAVSNPMKDNILNDLENNNMANGNYSIDYLRAKKNKFNSNMNLSGCLPGQLHKNNENNIEDINKNEKLDKSIHRTKSAKKIMNLKNNDNNTINNNEGEIINEKTLFFENIKKFLLFPYFLPKYTKNIEDVTLKKIEEAIEVYTTKKNFKFQCQDKDHVFIISKRHGYKFNNITQKRIYLLPKNKNDNFGLNTNLNISKDNNNNNDINYINHSNTGTIKNLRNEKCLDNAFTKDDSIDNIDINAINNNQKDNNNNNCNNNNKNSNNNNNTEIHNTVNSINKNPEEKKLIKVCFSLCYTNKNRISKEQLTSLDKIFLDEDNKLFFAKLILPDNKIKKTKNHKLLTSTSFEDLGKMLSLSLEHLTSNEYNACRLLTISSFVYYKIENKKIIYLYQTFIQGIYPCRLWLYDEFWANFFDLEFEEEKKNEKDLLNLYKYNINGSINYMLDIEKNIIEKNKEQILYETTSFMAEIMIKLKLSKKLILNTFNNKILGKYIEDNNKIRYFMNQILEMFDKF